jgi:hypothetical protein
MGVISAPLQIKTQIRKLIYAISSPNKKLFIHAMRAWQLTENIVIFFLSFPLGFNQKDCLGFIAE